MSEPPITEPMPAPEVFVDGYASSAIHNGVVKLTFFSVMHNPAQDRHERRIVARVSMAIPVFAAVHQAFGSFLEQLEQQARSEPGTQ